MISVKKRKILWVNAYSLGNYRVFNLKVDRQLSREYLTSDVIYIGSAGMTLYYYMCMSWQDCCRRGENRSWPSATVESVAIFYAFIMRLTVDKRVFILESYLKAPTVDKVSLKNLEF